MTKELEHSSWVLRDERRVDIVVGPGARHVLARLVGELGDYSMIVIVADSGLPGRFVDEVAGVLRQSGARVESLAPGSGEELKTLHMAEKLWRWLLRVGADRGTLLVAYGGGALSDTAGFVAATYMRGIDWAVLPTTLLSMADAAAGGKTAINLGAKNIVGAFHHPRLIVADTEHLETLSERDYVSGLAEVVKHALLEGRWFLDWLVARREEILGRRHEALARMIRMSLDAKMRIVSRDPREEKGDRMLLNLGHTVAHVVEKATGYQLRHGEAVSMGLVVEAKLATRITGLPGEELEEIMRVLSGFGLPTRPPRDLDPGEALRLAMLDKKRRGDKITLPLLKRIGEPVLVELGLEEALRLLRDAWEEVLRA